MNDLGAAIEGLGRLLASRRVATRFTDVAGTEVSQQGLAVLRALHRHGRQPIAAVAAAAHMDVAAVSRQLRALEADALVCREPDAADARVVHVSATPAGHGIARRVQTVQRRHLDTALSGWSERDKEVLACLLTRLVTDLRATPVR